MPRLMSDADAATAQPVDPPVSAERSRMMARVRGKNTQPEIVVRQLAHALGYRFRLHRRDLPGCPDIVFPGHRKAIFVHGCFWHQHRRCGKATLPKTRRSFWAKKLAANEARDKRDIRSLRAMGWRVLILWECQLRDTAGLGEKLHAFLRSK